MDFHDDEDTMKDFEEELEKAEKLMGSIKTQAQENQQQTPGECILKFISLFTTFLVSGYWHADICPVATK